MRNEFQFDPSVLPKELSLLLLILQEEEQAGLSDPGERFSRNVRKYIPRCGSISTVNAPVPEDGGAVYPCVDWSLFIELAVHHRVFPYVYHKLKEHAPAWIPADVIRKLQRDYRKNTFQMLGLSGEMEQFCKWFTDNRIRVLFLKGPALAADLYGEISLRTSCDLDMLVSADDLDKVHELLIMRGYVKDEYFSTVTDDWKWRHHHVTYFHSHKGIKAEIHWRLNPGPSWEPTFQELWNRRRGSPLTSEPVYMLGREDLFLFLVTHGARHGWSRLRWLLDIDRIARQDIDWKQVRSRLGKYQFLQVGGQGLLLSAQLLKTPLTAEARSLTDGPRPHRLANEAMFYIERMVHLHKEPVPLDVALYHKRHLFSLMSFRHKCVYLLSLLYPYPVDAETMPLPKKLHFLYFLLRPVLVAWRKMHKREMLKGDAR